MQKELLLKQTPTRQSFIGFLLAWVFPLADRILLCHFLNNTFYLVQLYVAAHSNEKTDVSKLDVQLPLWAGLASIIVFYFLFVLFKRVSAKNRSAIEMDEQKLWIQSTPQYNLADNNNPFN